MTEFAWDSLPYRVRSAGLVTPVIRELWLEPAGEAMPFRAGQYLLLSDAGCRIPQRSYSVANAPRADGLLSLLVTMVPGGPTSTWAHHLGVGDEVSVEGPFGTFVVSAGDRSPVLLLGAGSGIAPLRALAEDLVDAGTDLVGAGADLVGAAGSAQAGGAGSAGAGGAGSAGAVTAGSAGAGGAGSANMGAVTAGSAGAGGAGSVGAGTSGSAEPGAHRPVTLFFSGRTPADAIDSARFQDWSRALPGFDYRLTCTRDAREQRHARIPDLLAAEFPALDGTAVFAAGPPGFVAGCRRAALALGADPADIRTEEFFAEPGVGTTGPA